MKNQDEDKNRNKFHSNTFIHVIADLIRPLYIFCILMSNIYIYIYIFIYIAGIHGTLYRAWWFDLPDGAQVQSPKNSNYLMV